MRTTEADASNFHYPKDGGHANDWKDRSVATEQYLKGNLGVKQKRKIRSNRAQSTEYYMHTDPTAANRRRATPVTNEGRGITRDQTRLAPELVSQLRQSWKAEKTERLAPSPSHHNGEAGSVRSITSLAQSSICRDRVAHLCYAHMSLLTFQTRPYRLTAAISSQGCHISML